MNSLSTSLALSSSALLLNSVSILSSKGFSTAFAFLSLIALVNSFLSITTPSSEGPAFREASFTSPALSPKMARSSFSSGEGSDSPLGVIAKITPKGESDPSPEEKLLRAIFGDKAGDVKDASLKAGPSLDGVVIDKKLFTRAIKDRKAKAVEKPLLDKIETEFNRSADELKARLVDKLFILVNGKTSQGVKDYLNVDVIPKGSKFTLKQLQEVDFLNANPNKWTTDKKKNDSIKQLLHNYLIKHKEIDGVYKRRKYNITIGDELPTGIVRLAKVYIAKKRKVKVGDKMALIP